MKFYAGIGSRKITELIYQLMVLIAKKLETENYTLRSGGAKGSDTAFEEGVEKLKEIFVSSDAVDWAYKEVKTCMPNDRKGFDHWKPYIRGLLARNMMQVLGKTGEEPVNFVICYAPSFKYETSDPGGTGYAIRCALKYSIPVYNLYDIRVKEKIEKWLETDIPFEEYMAEEETTEGTLF